MNKVFEFALDASHPIVAQHLVLEQPVLPGLAYIDLLLQLAGGQMGLDYRLLAVSKLTIFNPLVVLEGQPVRLKFEFAPLATQQKHQAWSVSVTNAVSGSQYISAQLYPGSELNTRNDNIQNYQQHALTKVDMDSIYQRARSRGLLHQGMMKAQGQIYLSDTALLVELRASSAQSGQNLVCHPALIDGAAMATEALREAQDDSLLLPLYYERFVCTEAMGDHCYALVLKDSITSVNDIHKLDIHFFTKDGLHCASLTGMTSKQVRSSEPFAPTNNVSKPTEKKNTATDTIKPKTAKPDTTKPKTAAKPVTSATSLIASLQKLVADELQQPINQVSTEAGFFALGLQSSQMLGLLADIEKRFSLTLSPTLFFEYGSIAEVAAHLETQVTFESSAVATNHATKDATNPVTGDAKAQSSNHISQSFSFDCHQPLMADHIVYSTPALMGIVHPCLGFELLGATAFASQALQNIVFTGGPVTANNDGLVNLTASLSQPSADSPRLFESYHIRDDGQQNLCCRAQVISAQAKQPAPLVVASLLQQADKLDSQQLDKLYSQIDDFTIGAALRTISSAFITPDQQLVSFYQPAQGVSETSNGYQWPPLLLNSCFYLHPAQLLMDGSQILVPMAIERLTLFAPLNTAALIVTQLRHSKKDFVSFDSTIYDLQGHCLAQVENASMAVVKNPQQLDNANFAALQTGSARATQTQDIAIIGLSGAYPKAPNLKAFWQNLRDGVDCIEPIPASRAGWQSYLDAAAQSGIDILSRKGGFIEDVDKFDPLFFTISPREAAHMDPQQRLFLEHSWNALEDGGYHPSELIANSRAIGVYAGAMSQEYALYAPALMGAGQPIGAPTGLGAIANRVSYFFDFQGPSITLDTMCSSSLSAIALAVDDLHQHKIEAALAGGVNVSVHPNKYLMLSEGKFMSRLGRCSAFGSDGDGYIPAEGVGVVLLKRLSDAQADGAHIYGLIKAVTVNHGGRTAGFTVPSPASQYQVIVDAWQQSDINPADISYVEAHGTGTLLGDPIEIAGLSKAFSHSTDARQFCAIGSVKSNIGHCESAAGVAGLSKILLQFKHQQLVPSLHSDALNPNIDFTQSPFTVQQTLTPWTRKQNPIGQQAHLAALSSFGAGGSNAHIVLSEYLAQSPVTNELADETSDVLIVLSANSDDELVARARDLLEWLEHDTHTSVANIAYTLQIGRKAMAVRLAVVVNGKPELKAQLRAFCDNGQVEAINCHASPDKSSDKITDKSELHGLAKRWNNGESIQWQSIYSEQQRQQLSRIPLPTYPFNKQRCWLPTVNQTLTSAKPQCWLLTEQWQIEKRQAENHPSVQVASQETAANHPSTDGYQLIFLSEPNHCQQFLAEFERQQGHCRLIFVRHVEGDIELSLSDWPLDKVKTDATTTSSPTIQVELNRHNKQHINQLLNRLATECGRIDNIYYLWAIEDSSIYADSQNLLMLLQSIMATKLDIGRVWLAADKTAQPSINHCYLESWLTLGLSLKRLYPQRPVACIINHLATSEVDICGWGQRLIQVSSHPSTQPQSTNSYFDGAQRQTCGFELEPFDTQSAEPVAIRQYGTYVITGGMGGLGQHFAHWLVNEFAATVILLGRSALNASKQATLERLNQTAGTAIYVQTDVTDAAALTQALHEVVNKTGPVYGVIHGAGISEHSAFEDKTADIFTAVMSAKIEGTLALDQAMATQPLDFFCLFSSLAAVLGDFGGCDYALANRFQQAYGEYRRGQNGQQPGKSLVINWPLWAGDGLDFGDPQSQDFYLKSSGQHALDSETGIAIFARILNQPAGVYTLMYGDGALIEKTLRVDKVEPSKALNITDKINYANHESATDEADIPAQLVAEVSAILDIEPQRIGHDINLADFGFDSVTLQTLASNLEQRFDITLSATLFYSHPTIARLAAYLTEKYASRLGSSSKHKSNSESSSTSNNQPDSRDDSHQDERIAIIGISGRFPGATDVGQMWQLLAEGKASIGNIGNMDDAKAQRAVDKIPSGRFDWAQICKNYTDVTPEQLVGGAFAAIDGIDEFDPLFFAIAKSEAALIDPRQRLLLQQSYWALEDACYAEHQKGADNIGIFVGAEQGGYMDVKAQGESITANHDAMLAARLAYHLDLSGPALVVNTACSSGLVALHQACVNIRSFECDSAVVGAVNLMLSGESFVGMSQAGMLSPDGRCYTFDKRANGMVPGEAVVAVVIKRLSLAEADGNPIYAQISASGSNQDGRTNGITAPNGAAQSALINRVYQRFGIDPSSIDYIVAHGTGTALGDPIEINALAEIFPQSATGQPYCSLGSFKTNFGHTFAAAGLVSLVGLVKALEHQQIPACVNFQSPSEHVDWQNSPFYVNQALKAWPQPTNRLRSAAISAFGMSGTNAHVVIEQYNRSSSLAKTEVSAHNLLVLSARTAKQLEHKIADLLSVMSHDNDINITALCKTLQVGRQHFQYRLAIVVDDVQSGHRQLIASLKKALADGEDANLVNGEKPRHFVYEKGVVSKFNQLIKQADKDSLRQLAGFYCQGHTPDWSILYTQGVVTGLHLPGYPFERQTYWRERASDVTQTALSTVEQAPVQAEKEPIAAPCAVQASIIALILEHLGLQPDEISDQDSFDDFGLDSISSLRLLAKIRKQLPEVSDTLFLEYPSLAEVKTYLAGCNLSANQNKSAIASEPVSNARSITTKSADTTHSEQNSQQIDINIVGLAGYFPGADNIDEFWQNLVNEKSITRVLPQRRCELLGLTQADNKPSPHWIGGYLDDIERFDAERYKLSATEAAKMDPLLRLLIEAVADAIEDSGDTLKTFKKRPTGVFVGSSGHSGYQDIGQYVNPKQSRVKGEQGALYANRISNLLDLKGQSSTMDAGCASFLVAINQAVEALKKGLCQQAVVATGQLYLSPYDFIGKPASGLYASNGETQSLGFDSDGYVRSELIGAIVLKAADIKQADSEQSSYGAIKAVGIAHGGKSPLKWYSPNIKGQKAAISAALQQTDCLPDYIELEANGSQLGDASELVALQAEYGKAKKTQPGMTRFSSFKPLTGHAETASTFAALVKTLFSFNTQTQLAVPGLTRLNQNITLKEGFEIVRGQQTWPQVAGQRRCAAVHSLSVGGVNAHMIVEQSNHWPQPSKPAVSRAAIQADKPQYWLTEVAPSMPEPDLYQTPGVLLLKPDWHGPLELDANSAGTPSVAAQDDVYCHRVFCGWSAQNNQQWQTLALEKSEIHCWQDERQDDSTQLDEQLLNYFKKAYILVQQLLKDAVKRPVQLQLVLPSALDKIGLQGLIGLVRTANQEHSGFSGQIVVAHQQISSATMEQWLPSVAKVKALTYLQFRPQGVWTQNWDEIPLTRLASKARKNCDDESESVILITGGLGGLGSLLASKILATNPNAQVVLSGRREVDNDILAKITTQNERLSYLPCDISDAQQTTQLIEQIVQQKGKISGVYHCAGVNKDAYIVNQSLAQVEAVLAPKIAGVNNLDRATAEHNLGFFTIFSSISGVFGNAGQADYAMANAYLDVFSAWRNQQILLGERTGHTTSIAWPLWAGGGMTVEPEVLEKLEIDFGFLPLPDEKGTDLSVKLTTLEETQVAVTYGHMIPLLTRLAKMRFL